MNELIPFDGFALAALKGSMALTAVNSLALLVAPDAYIAFGKRLAEAMSFPHEPFDKFWSVVPPRLIGAVYLVISLAVLFALYGYGK